MSRSISFALYCLLTAPALAVADYSSVLSRRAIVNCRPGECKWREQQGWIRPDEVIPGTRPFDPPQCIEIETDRCLPGFVELRFKAVPKGPLYSFTGEWSRVTRIVTDLPKGMQYRLHDLVFSRAEKTADCLGHIEIRGIDGFYRTDCAGACLLDVRTTSPLHVFRQGTERPILTLQNTSNRDLTWSGTIRMADFLGHTRMLPIRTFVRAGGCCEIEVPSPPLEKGVWMAFGEVHGEDGSVAKPETRFAVLDDHGVPSRLSKGKFRMGINYHVNRYFPICRSACNEALKACGAKLVRIGLGTWRSVCGNSSSGSCDWSDADRTLDEMLSLGCDVNAGCWSIPEAYADADLRERALREDNWKVWATIPPRDTKRLEAYYEQLAKHYGTRIAYYEIGNEWDLPVFFPGSTAEAVRGFSAAARALRRGCPAACVIPCGWAGADDSKMIRNVGIQHEFMRSCRGLYDAHAVHLHGDFKKFRRRLTESFFPLRQECGITVPWYANETAVSIVHVGELATAENVWKKILFSWAHGSTDYIWYNLRATGWDSRDSEQGYGMLTPDFYPRASFAAFSALSKLLSGFDFADVVLSEENREFYRFRGIREEREEQVFTGWETAVRNKTRSVRVRTDAVCAMAVDMMGNACEVPVVDGLSVWQVGNRPSAFRLIDVRFAELERGDLDVTNLPPKVINVESSANAKRPADLTIANAEFVNNYFEANPGMVHRLWKGPTDCSFRIWFDEVEGGGLKVRIKVADDVHSQKASAVKRMSEGDCVRLDFDVSGQEGVWQLGFRRTDSGVSESCVWKSPVGYDVSEVLDKVRLETVRTEKLTTYSILLPVATMGFGDDPLDGHVKVSVKVDDADEEDRDLWIGLDGFYSLERKNK